MSRKKKTFIKAQGSYAWNDMFYWGNFYKWLRFKRRGYIKWDKELNNYNY